MSIVKELRYNAEFAHKVTGCSIKDHISTKAADEIEAWRSAADKWDCSTPEELKERIFALPEFY